MDPVQRSRASTGSELSRSGLVGIAPGMTRSGFATPETARQQARCRSCETGAGQQEPEPQEVSSFGFVIVNPCSSAPSWKSRTASFSCSWLTGSM